jgi:Flp pilus assembly protein TadD
LAGYYLRTGQASEALGVLREVQSLYPNHPAFLTEKGKAELALQDPDSALATFRKLVDVQPKSAEAHYLLAKVLAMTNDAEGTHREMDKALSLDPNHFPTKVAMVRRLMVENKPQEASRLLGELQQTHPENPELIALEGWLALHQGQFEKAATIYRKALDQAPSSPLAIDLARAQWEGGDKQGAVATLQSWLQKMPADPSARLALAQVYVGLEQREAAQDAFQRLIELAPDNVPALTGLARLLQEEDPDRARSLYEEALKRQPDQLPLQMELAALEMRQGRKEDAKSRLEQALWKNPKALQPRLLLAAYYLSAGQPEEGLALLKEVEPLFPDRPELLTALGNAQLAAGKPEAALATFKKLVKVVPKSADAHYLLAKTLAETKDIQGMRRELTAALTLQPEHFLAKLAMTRQLMVENKPEEARKLLQELQKTHPGHPELLVQEGWLASREERYGDAAAAYTEALKQVPNSQVVGLLADVQWRSGDRQGAVTTLEAWLAQHPADQAVRYLLANYYLLLDAKEAARDTYGKFLELSPDHPLAMNNLAWLLRKEDPVNALRYAERALEIAPEIAVVMDTLGTLLVEQNQVERGLQLLREASRKAPQDPAIRYHLAQALARSGNTQEAQTLVSQLLQDQKPFAEREEAQALLRQLQGL